ncbi:MAG: TIGR03936 family radical SAM-associated protein [Thermoanaerobacteraceae bacterium]|nr:TIGR03936 family radical SAM-associated protein [Thermoanaerobacteraceae bacterium]
MKLRNRFMKADNLRFISHLDLMRVIERAMRRGDIKFSLSKGFNPHPLISFGPALMLGATTHGDYFDVIIENNLSPQEFKDRMNAVLPECIYISDSYEVGEKDLLSQHVKEAEYIVKARLFGELKEIQNQIEAFMTKDKIIIEKETKKGKKDIDLKPYILNFNYISTDEGWILLYIKLTIAEGSPGPLYVINAFNKFIGDKIDTETYRLDRKDLILD